MVMMKELWHLLRTIIYQFEKQQFLDQKILHGKAEFFLYHLTLQKIILKKPQRQHLKAKCFILIYIKTVQFVQTYQMRLEAQFMISLLSDPNPNSPANAEASKLYLNNRQEYIERVKKIVEKSNEEQV